MPHLKAVADVPGGAGDLIIGLALSLLSYFVCEKTANIHRFVCADTACNVRGTKILCAD